MKRRPVLPYGPMRPRKDLLLSTCFPALLFLLSVCLGVHWRFFSCVFLTYRHWHVTMCLQTSDWPDDMIIVCQTCPSSVSISVLSFWRLSCPTRRCRWLGCVPVQSMKLSGKCVSVIKFMSCNLVNACFYVLVLQCWNQCLKVYKLCVSMHIVCKIFVHATVSCAADIAGLAMLLKLDTCPMWAWELCRISPPRFLVECHMRRLNQASFVLLYFVLFVCFFLGCA